MDALWICLAFAAGLLAHRIGLPPLVGYLAAGFGLHAAGERSGPAIEQVAHLGVLLLMFTIGLKLRLQYLARPEIWGGGLAHLGLFALLAGVLVWLLAAQAPGPATALGLALGFSSTVIAAKSLEAKQELRSFHGRVAIGILIVQDLAAVGLLSIAAEAPHPAAAGLLLLPLARPLLLRLLSACGHDELLLVFGLALAAGAGALFHALGLSAELGALAAGALLAAHGRAGELAGALWGLKEAFLLGFFLQIGLAGGPDAATFFGALGLLLLLPLKAAALFFVLIAFRLRARSAFLSALSLASYSEFALIVAQLGVQAGWLDAQWLTLLALAIAASFALGAPLNRLAHPLFERWEDRLLGFERHVRHPDEEPIHLGAAHLLVIGMGRAGTVAYDYLVQHERVVGLDSDLSRVGDHLHAGRRVLYADAEDPGLWHHLHLSGIRAVLLMMRDAEARVIAARQLRRHGFTGLIAAISHYPDEAAAITAAGADMTFTRLDQVGLGLAEHVLGELRQRAATAR